MRVILPNALSALAGIRRQLDKFKKARGRLPDVYPVFPGEFRRACAELKRQRKRVAEDHFMLRGVEIIPGKGTFLWRAGTWVHQSIAWEIRKDGRSAQVMRDLEPYMTVAGDVANKGERVAIGGRRQHREFLRRNRLVELGNEMPKGPAASMPSVKPDLERAMQTGMTPDVRAAAERANRALDRK